jgi:hypothetical protein
VVLLHDTRLGSTHGYVDGVSRCTEAGELAPTVGLVKYVDSAAGIAVAGDVDVFTFWWLRLSQIRRGIGRRGVPPTHDVAVKIDGTAMDGTDPQAISGDIRRH